MGPRTLKTHVAYPTLSTTEAKVYNALPGKAQYDMNLTLMPSNEKPEMDRV